MIKKCLICDKDFFTHPHIIKNGDGKYCSKKCYHQSWIGKKHSQKSKDKMSFSRKGDKNWNYGKHLSIEVKKKIAIKARIQCAGNGNPNWRGGVHQESNGYILIYKPEHPHPTTRHYVYKHRLVMEKKLGRYLKPEEIVHHKNGIVSDNKIKNLQLFKNNSEHQKNHHPKGIKFGKT